MKHTEEQIIAIAENIMQQIDFSYNTKVKIHAGFRSVEEQFKPFEGLKHAEEYKLTLKPIWTVFFKFEEEYEIRRDSIFLDIDDESGEPIELSHAQATFIISKDENGKYIKTIKPRR